jgi:hypothetical protein
MAWRHIGQSMTIAHSTSKWRGQKINAYCISALQENYSHWIRRKMAMPEATFFIFFSFSSLYHECNLSPLLRSYKRGGRGHF